MSFEKRPRSPNGYFPAHANIIDLTSDDDQPPRKRQKSTTPTANGVIRNFARPTTARSPTPESNEQYRTTSNANAKVSTKKTSPFKNRPAWLKQSLLSDSSPNINNIPAKTNDKDEGVFQKRSNHASPKSSVEWTRTHNNLLRGLSLGSENSTVGGSQSHENQAYPSNTPRPGDRRAEIEVEAEHMINKFKIPPARPLKFNPSNSSSILETRTNDANVQIYNGFDNDHVKPRLTYAPETESHSRLKPSLTRTSTPSPRPGIEVRLPQRMTPSLVQQTPSTTTASVTIKQANLFPARPQQPQKFQIEVPLSDQARHKRERKHLQEKLKQGAEYAKDHPEEVQRLLGMTGFSTEFPADLDEAKYRQASQPKKRAIDRNQIVLDLKLPDRPPPPPKLETAVRFIHPKEQAKAILTARFAEQINPPLTFSNTVNDRRLNGKFQFVSEYIFRKGVKVTGLGGRSGCACIDQCDATCACLKERFKDDKKKPNRLSRLPQYERRADGLVVLEDDFIRSYTIHADMLINNACEDRIPEQRAEILECSEYCSCGDSCTNRVVQRGRTVSLEIFETNRCGFGVRSSANLVRGQFIELYLGEVITENELNKREEAAEAGSTSYMYSLDWFSPHQPYHIDGENFGSAMRFVNHSCDPNAGTFTVLDSQSTKQLHHVAFFAIKDIPAGTEITIDYTPQAAGTRYELNTVDDGMERCYCGANNCRQMLWLPGKERKARKKTVGRTFN